MKEVDLSGGVAGGPPAARNQEEFAALEARPQYTDATVLDKTYAMPAKELQQRMFMDPAQGGVYYKFLEKMEYFEIQLGAFADDGANGLSRQVRCTRRFAHTLARHWNELRNIFLFAQSPFIF